jgi:hypothetical protein
MSLRLSIGFALACLAALLAVAATHYLARSAPKEVNEHALPQAAEGVIMPPPQLEFLPGRDDAKPRRILETGYRLLKEIDREERGYGLYSYAILVQDNKRSTEFLGSVFGDKTHAGIPPVEETAAPEGQTNIFYVPLKKVARTSILKALRASVQDRAEAIAQFVKTHYDYKMSRSILMNLCRSPAEEIVTACTGDLSRGPYIFAYAKPASNVAPVPPPFLFLDLSDVHERAFPEIIAAFKAQVKREDITDRAKIDTLRLGLLNIVLTAADWVSPVQKALADIVHTATGAKK